jgi:hypothetical protein
VNDKLTIRIPEEIFKQIGADPKASGLAIIAEARALTIANQSDLARADEFRQVRRRFLQMIEEAWDPQIAQANALHKGLLAKKAEYADPHKSALTIVNSSIATYIAEQDRIRLQAEREKSLAEERAKREAERAVDKATELLKKGEEEKAQVVVDKAREKIEAFRASVPVVPDAPVADVSLRKSWDFEITDVDKIPRKYMVPDLVMIRRVVTATKDQCSIPGIRAFEKTTVADKRGSKF